MSYSDDLSTYHPDIENVGQSIRDFLWVRHPIHSFFTLIAPIPIALVLLYFLVTANGIDTDATEILGGFSLTVSLLITILSYARVSSRMESLFFTELASTLGCKYSKTAVPPKNGFIFSIGTARIMTNVLSGAYKNISILLADYRYDTGSGKSRETHQYTIGSLATTGSLPSIMCVPVGWTHTLINEWKLPGYTSLHLEGNFNTKFSVYVPQGKEIEALQILEPDVMEKLMDGYERFGFQCIDSSVYIFTPGAIREKRENVLKLYTLMQQFCEVMLPELQRFMR